MTWTQMCQDEARKVGIELTVADADWVLWEHTGFPSFYEGDDAEGYFRKQIRQWALSTKR